MTILRRIALVAQKNFCRAAPVLGTDIVAILPKVSGFKQISTPSIIRTHYCAIKLNNSHLVGITIHCSTYITRRSHVCYLTTYKQTAHEVVDLASIWRICLTFCVDDIDAHVSTDTNNDGRREVWYIATCCKHGKVGMQCTVLSKL